MAVRKSSRRMRVNMASPSPNIRALFCWWTGSRATMMERNTMLSMPSTISIAVRVTRAIHVSGWNIHSMTSSPQIFSSQLSVFPRMVA
ncbi:MAG: hypothetical protein BWX71_01348 [Deltaproteobacteria bacterium ADurb.Bin072]|nr:MAG: hypothetical protein BWX71_01348 [Deltaproteobacteria bacterium ADurb.Bin072]